MKAVYDMMTVLQKNLFYTLNFRAMDRYIKKHNGNKSLVGVEVGVFGGGHAIDMLHHLPIKKLYLVDPYMDYDDYPELKGLGEHTMKDAQKRLKSFKDKTVWVRKTSEDAVSYISDDLDFVYIDANHRYSFVKQDIECWYPKIREGGILGGHDFGTAHKGVSDAVLEFVYKMGLDLLCGGNDWWIVKNKLKMKG